MQELIGRHLAGTVKRRLQNNPAVAILGPRQCGKTTLAGQIVKKFSQSVYLDLENPADLAKLSLPFSVYTMKTWCVSTKSNEPPNSFQFFEVS